MINYPFVYPTREGERARHLQGDGAAKYPQVDPSLPSKPPLGGINLGGHRLLRAQGPGLRRRSSACIQPENQLATANAGGLPPVRTDALRQPDVKKAYPGFADLIKHSIQDAAARPSIARLPGRLAGDPGRGPPDDDIDPNPRRPT